MRVRSQSNHRRYYYIVIDKEDDVSALYHWYVNETIQFRIKWHWAFSNSKFTLALSTVKIVAFFWTIIFALIIIFRADLFSSYAQAVAVLFYEFWKVETLNDCQSVSLKNCRISPVYKIYFYYWWLLYEKPKQTALFVLIC